MSYIVLGGGGRVGRVIVNYLRKHTKQVVYAVDPTISHIVSDTYIGWHGTLDSMLQRRNHHVSGALEGAVVISCLRPELTPSHLHLAECKGALGFLDLGGDDAITTEVRERNHPYRLSVVLDCGLAPGIMSSIAGKAVREGKKNVKIWCGGVPMKDFAPYDYVLSFSPEGLVGEMIGAAQIIRDSEVAYVPTLTETEYINVDNAPMHLQPMQASFTSGGLSFTPEALAGVLDSLTYKTLRPAGHFKWLKEEILWRGKEEAAAVLSKVLVPVSVSNPDLIILGYQIDNNPRVWYKWEYDPKNNISAMAQATGNIAAAVATMIYEERFAKGVTGMHDVSLDDIMKRTQEEPKQFIKYAPVV